jgi:foldase protein PrsA
MDGYLLVKGPSLMKVKYLLVLTLAVLLVTTCGPQMTTPTPQVNTGNTTEAPTAVAEVATVAVDEAVTAIVSETATLAASEAATPTAGESITTTMPITPTGGVEVALAAIKRVDGVLATVNGQDITWADYEPELRQVLHNVTQQYGVDWNQAENIKLLAQFQDQVLQTVVDRALLRQMAAKEGIEVSPEELQASIDEQEKAILDSGQYGSLEQFLEVAGLSEEYFARLVEDTMLVKKVSEAHAPARESEQVHARHILVADEETGKQVLARLNAGEDWAALAAEYSQDTSNKDTEGDLGWFPRGVMVAAFEEAAFSLEPGKTSDLIKTDFGYHLIQVLEKGMRELDEQTYNSMVEQAFQTWLDEQKTAAKTEILATFGSGQ